MAQISVKPPTSSTKALDSIKQTQILKQKKQLQQIKTAPRVTARLARPDCSPPSTTDVLITGRFTRPTGGAALGAVHAYAVYPDRTVEVSAPATRTDNAVDFRVIDGTLGSGSGLPVAYTIDMRYSTPGATSLSNTRVPIRWRWNPHVSAVTSLYGARVTREGSDGIHVQLPNLRFDQISSMGVLLGRNGRGDALTSTEFRAQPGSHRDVGAYSAEEVLDVYYRHVPAAWRDTDPATWAGTIQIRAFAEATACSGGHRSTSTFSLPYSASAPTTTTDTGDYYRVQCLCNNEYQYADVQVKACNADGLGLPLRCQLAATRMNEGSTGPWQCLLVSSEDHPDRSSCNPIPENFLIESIRQHAK